MVTKAAKNSQTSQRRKQKTKAKRPGVSKQKVKEKPSPPNRFVRDLLVRSEAKKPDSDGKLPLDATHAVTKEDKDGSVVVKRVRFKYF
jgi:hypothetical protein